MTKKQQMQVVDRRLVCSWYFYDFSFKRFKL